MKNMLECANDDSDFLKTEVTSDEYQLYMYSQETKVQSAQWKSPRLDEARHKWRIKLK